MLIVEEVVIVSRRPLANRLALLALVLLVGVGLWSFGKGNPAQEPQRGGNASPNQVSLRETGDSSDDQIGREPADLDQLERAVSRTSIALERSSWEEAEANSRQLQQRWLSFKPAMRAQAGTRIWSTQDTDAFSDGLDALEAHIQSRRRAAAQNEIQRLHDIIRRYQSAREPSPDPATRRETEPQITD